MKAIASSSSMSTIRHTPAWLIRRSAVASRRSLSRATPRSADWVDESSSDRESRRIFMANSCPPPSRTRHTDPMAPPPSRDSRTYPPTMFPGSRSRALTSLISPILVMPRAVLSEKESPHTRSPTIPESPARSPPPGVPRSESPVPWFPRCSPDSCTLFSLSLTGVSGFSDRRLRRPLAACGEFRGYGYVDVAIVGKRV